MTSLHQEYKTAEAYGYRSSLKEVHQSSCLFVFIRGSSSLQRSVVFPGMIRPVVWDGGNTNGERHLQEVSLVTVASDLTVQPDRPHSLACWR